jgi:predicted aspartyl protease
MRIVCLLAAACGPHQAAPSSATAPLARVPVHFFAERVPFVDVKVAGRDLSFIVDTGADSELIDAAIAKQLALKVENPQTVAQPGGAIAMGKVTGARIAIGALATDTPDLIAAPLSPLTHIVGRPLDGLIGHTLLRRYVVELDYAAQTIAFYDPATAHPRGTAIPLEISDIDAYVNVELVQAGRTVTAKLELDTGSFDALGLSDRFVQANQLTANKQPIDVPGVAIGGETSGYRLRLDRMRLGPFELVNVPMGATRARPTDEPLTYAGTLGAEVLRRFTVVLDYPHQRMFLAPRTSLSSELAVDCGGLVLRAVGDHLEQLVVHAVIPASPAERAGLKSGDVIVAVNGAPLDGRALESLFEKLYRPGQKLVFRVTRNGAASEIALVTKQLY